MIMHIGDKLYPINAFDFSLSLLRSSINNKTRLLYKRMQEKIIYYTVQYNIRSIDKSFSTEVVECIYLFFLTKSSLPDRVEELYSLTRSARRLHNVRNNIIVPRYVYIYYTYMYKHDHGLGIGNRISLPLPIPCFYCVRPVFFFIFHIKYYFFPPRYQENNKIYPPLT